jgi:hypothetical protein
MADSLAPKNPAPSRFLYYLAFGDQQLGGDTTDLEEMIGENSTLKHGSRGTNGTKRDMSVLSYLDRILTELRQLLELGTDAGPLRDLRFDLYVSTRPSHHDGDLDGPDDCC